MRKSVIIIINIVVILFRLKVLNPLSKPTLRKLHNEFFHSSRVYKRAFVGAPLTNEIHYARILRGG